MKTLLISNRKKLCQVLTNLILKSTLQLQNIASNFQNCTLFCDMVRTLRIGVFTTPMLSPTLVFFIPFQSVIKNVFKRLYLLTILHMGFWLYEEIMQQRMTDRVYSFINNFISIHIIKESMLFKKYNLILKKQKRFYTKMSNRFGPSSFTIWKKFERS